VKTDRKAADRQDHKIMKSKLLIISALAIAIATITAPLARADFLSGTGAPSSELGSNGDHYLDAQTSKLYKKASDSWAVLVTRLAIKGDKGDRGETGPRGPAGPVGPNGPGLRAFATPAALTAAAPQFAGQMAIVTSTNALYRGTGTTAGAWTLIPTTAGQ
jgi:hypothetical protein